MENKHPYCFIAKSSIKDLLTATHAMRRTLPLIPKLVPILRQCFMTHDTVVISNGLYGLRCYYKISFIMCRQRIRFSTKIFSRSD